MRNKFSPEQVAAVEQWIVQLRCPEIAQDSVRAKFRRLDLSAQEIEADMVAKLARENSK